MLVEERGDPETLKTISRGVFGTGSEKSAYLGHPQLQCNDDVQGPIASFMTALSLEPTHYAVVLDFINVFNDTGDYDGILKLFENNDDDVI